MTKELRKFQTVASYEFQMATIDGELDVNYCALVMQEVDDYGNHRLRCGDYVGEWNSYNNIATLQVPSIGQFAGTTDYYKGVLPRLFQYITSFTESVNAEPRCVNS